MLNAAVAFDEQPGKVRARVLLSLAVAALPPNLVQRPTVGAEA
jgi:hypothetical protein